jgi:mRNA interferase MazF
MAAYVPDRGDVIWMDFDPQTGHEQAGRRPAIILSPLAYNHAAGLALFCPVTNRAKGYPFEVPLPASASATGVVLADQVRSLDWRARRVAFIGALEAETLVQILEKLRPLVAHEDEPD